MSASITTTHKALFPTGGRDSPNDAGNSSSSPTPQPSTTTHESGGAAVDTYRRGSGVGEVSSSSPLPMSSVKKDLDAARESYFAAVVGRNPVPPRLSYTPLTPRRGIVNRVALTGDAVLDGCQANAQHKGRAADGVDSVLSTSSGLLSSVTNASDRLALNLKKSFDQTVAFNKEFKWVTPKGYALADVTSKGGLKLSVDTIANRWLKRPRHAPQSVLVPILDRISGGGGGGGAATAAIAEEGNIVSNEPQPLNRPAALKLSRVAVLDATDLFRTVDPHVDTTIPLKDSSNFAQLPKPTLSEMLLAQHNFLHVDVQNQAKEELARTNTDVERMTKQAHLLQADSEIYVSQRKYAEAEVAMKNLLNLEAQWMEVMCQRIAAMDLEDVDASEFAKEKDQLMRDLDDLLVKYRRDKDRAASDVAFDLRRCAELRQKTENQIADAGDIFAKNESDIEARLKLNEKHHFEIMKEITERAKILEKLSEDRRQMVMTTVRAREDHDREVFECNELKDRIAEYETLLNQVKSYLGEELSLCDVLENHSSTMGKHLNSRQFGSDIDDIRFHEMSTLKNIYEDFVSHSGTLSTKKQHRFDTIERQIRLAQLQRDTAKDSLDPNVKRHAEDLVALSSLLHETEQALTAIESQQDAVELLVGKVLHEYEGKCQQRGVSYRHPAEATTERVVAERRAFVDRTQQFVDEESDVVLRKKEALQKERNQTQIAAERHAALAASPPPLNRSSIGSPSKPADSRGLVQSEGGRTSSASGHSPVRPSA